MRLLIGFIFGVLVASASAQVVWTGNSFVPVSVNSSSSLPVIITAPAINRMMAIAGETYEGKASIIRTDVDGYPICSDYRPPLKP